jgi:hypothetical protein
MASRTVEEDRRRYGEGECGLARSGERNDRTGEVLRMLLLHLPVRVPLYLYAVPVVAMWWLCLSGLYVIVNDSHLRCSSPVETSNGRKTTRMLGKTMAYVKNIP